MHATIHMMCKSYRSVVLYRKEGPFSFSEPGPYRVWSTTYILRTSQHCTCQSGSRDSVQETVIFLQPACHSPVCCWAHVLPMTWLCSRQPACNQHEGQTCGDRE